MATSNQERFSLRVGVQVFFYARTKIGAWWNRMPLNNEFWRLYYNERAGVSLVSGASVHRVDAGRLVLVPPRFQGEGVIRGEMMHSFVHFDINGLPHGLVPVLFPRPMNVPGGHVLDTLVADWISECGRPREGDAITQGLRAEALVSQAFAACWEVAGVEQRPEWRAWKEHSPRLASIEAWMVSRLDQDLSVPRLAEWAGFSPNHFRRLFVRVFGMNPAAYVTQLRIREAARLLLFDAPGIEEISVRAGFVDRHHFSRVFRAVTGETPAAYRSRRKNQASSG